MLRLCGTVAVNLLLSELVREFSLSFFNLSAGFSNCGDAGSCTGVQPNINTSNYNKIITTRLLIFRDYQALEILNPILSSNTSLAFVCKYCTLSSNNISSAGVMLKPEP